MAFLRRHWRNPDDLVDFRQDVYEKVLGAVAKSEIPLNAKAYLFVTARNTLINATRRAAVVSFDLVADLEEVQQDHDMFATDRALTARDELRRTQAAMDALPPRCREVVRLRKVEGYSTIDTAEQLGVSVSTVEKDITSGMRFLTDHLLGGSPSRGKPLARLRRARQERWS